MAQWKSGHIVAIVLAFVVLLTGAGVGVVLYFRYQNEQRLDEQFDKPDSTVHGTQRPLRRVNMPTGEMVTMLPDSVLPDVLCSAAPKRIGDDDTVVKVYTKGTCIVSVGDKSYEVDAQSRAEASVFPKLNGERVTVAGRTGQIQSDELTKALVVPISQRLAGREAPQYPDTAASDIHNTLRVSSTDSAPDPDEVRSDMLAIARAILVNTTQPGPTLPPVTDKDEHIAPSAVQPQPVFGLSAPDAAQDICTVSAQALHISASTTRPRFFGWCDVTEHHNQFSIYVEETEWADGAGTDTIAGRPATSDESHIRIRLRDDADDHLVVSGYGSSEKELRRVAEAIAPQLVGSA